MKKILILAAFASALIVSAFGGTTASAASAEEDDFNAYIVATGEECLTEYYTQVGDGNATVTFELQWRSVGGYFGVVAGDSKKLGKLSEMTDYMLFGDGVVSSKTLDVETDVFPFDAARTGLTHPDAVRRGQRAVGDKQHLGVLLHGLHSNTAGCIDAACRVVMEIDDQSFHKGSVLVGAFVRSKDGTLGVDDDPVGACGQVVPQPVPRVAALAVGVRPIVAEQVVLFVGKACGRVFRTVEGRAVEHPGQRLVRGLLALDDLHQRHLVDR